MSGKESSFYSLGLFVKFGGADVKYCENVFPTGIGFALGTDKAEFSGHFGTKHLIFHYAGFARKIKMKS